MKIDGNFGIAKLLKILLKVCFLVLSFILIFLFEIVDLLNLHFDLFILSIYSCGLCFLVLIYQFIKLFESLEMFYKIIILGEVESECF